MMHAMNAENEAGNSRDTEVLPTGKASHWEDREDSYNEIIKMDSRIIF